MLAIRLRERLREERGFTLIELVASMAILTTVMGGLTTLLVSGTNAQVDLNRRFQAQTEARIGFDRFRREVHCASAATGTTGTAVSSITLTLASTCPTAGGFTSATWCTVANGVGRYGLWRYSGSSCTGTGLKLADYLTTQAAFTNLRPSTSLSKLKLTLAVNVTPSKPNRVYTLTDEIVLRNSARNP